MKISLRRCHALMIGNGAFSHEIFLFKQIWGKCSTKKNIKKHKKEPKTTPALLAELLERAKKNWSEFWTLKKEVLPYIE